MYVQVSTCPLDDDSRACICAPSFLRRLAQDCVGPLRAQFHPEERPEIRRLFGESVLQVRVWPCAGCRQPSHSRHRHCSFRVQPLLNQIIGVAADRTDTAVLTIATELGGILTEAGYAFIANVFRGGLRVVAWPHDAWGTHAHAPLCVVNGVSCDSGALGAAERRGDAAPARGRDPR